VDFSRIGSGIADAMKLGSSLQQYQMRKQAMEEEQATRESRIAQANAVARLAAARSQEAIKNVELMESTVAKQAEADRERASQILRSGILEFGPRADVERAKGVIALTPETTALTLAQTQAERARLPLETQAKNLGLTRQIGQAQRAIGRGLDELGETLSLQQQIQATALGGLKLGREQAEIINTEADTRLKTAQALAASMGKARDPLPVVKELNDQIDALLKRPMVYEDGTVTNLQAYEGRMAARARGEKEGIFRRDIKEDATLNKYLTQLNQLRALSDRYMQSAIGETGGTVLGGTRGGGGAGGGMAVNVPTLGGQAQFGTPYLDNLSARLQQALTERLGGGIAQVDQGAQVSQVPAISPPVLDDLINASVTTPTEGVVRTPAAAPAAAQGPAATMEIKDGKVVPVKSVMERAEGATQKAIEFAKDKPASALLAAATAKKVIPPAVKLSGSALNTLLSYTPQAIAVARTLANRATPVLAANEILGSFIRTDEKPSEETGLEIAGFKTKFGAGSAVPRIARLIAQSIYEPEGSKQIQDEIERIGEEIKSIAKSNLTATEKLSQIGPLREQQANLIQQITPRNDSTSIPSVPSASGGRALIFPGITSIRPGSDAPELTGPLTESNRIISDENTLASESESNGRKLTDFIKEYVRSVPSDSGGSALIFPKITSTAPKGKTKSTETAKELDEKELTEFLRKLFYGKNLEERINDILVREELKKTGGYNFGR
jgi:hypothetical protein